MKKAVILHGTGGSPDSNWFRWLETQLLNKGFEVWLPLLPNASEPNLQSALMYIHENRPFEFDEDTIVVGHSSGAVLTLALASQSESRLSAVVCVSVFDDLEQSPAVTMPANARLFDVAIDYERVRLHTGQRLFVHSDNDPYIPLAQARRVADSCAGELVVLEGQGHFNLEQSESYAAFPGLLELLSQRGIV